jgi:hypothetical protein
VQSKIRAANWQRYGNTKNYCHLKPRCIKCVGDHLTNQCLHKESSSDVRRVLWWKQSRKLQGMYNLQRLTKRSIPTTSSETIHTSCTNKKYPTNSTRNYIRYHQAKFLCAHKYKPHKPHKNQSHQQTSDMQYLKKRDEKLVSAHRNYAKPLQNRAN